MKRNEMGGSIIGLSLFFGTITGLTMLFLNIPLKTQIIFGMIPTIIIAFVGIIIHVYYMTKENSENKQQYLEEVDRP